MNADKRILIVDGDEAFAHMLAEQLQLHEEFVTVCAASGAEALERARVDYFDIIILEVQLPDMDGREVCAMMRQVGVDSPIIILSEADAEADIIRGLDSGADDYVTKPIRLGILLARLRAQIRQHEQSDDAVFRIGSYAFQPSAKMLVDDAQDMQIRLTSKEAAVLKYLYRTRNRRVSREVLLDEVWGYNTGITTHTLETHVHRLRQKIERNPAQALILVTEKGGYRLIPRANG